MPSKDPYLKRTTVFLRKDDRFDEELYEMLTIISNDRHIGRKLKELASEHLRTTQPELYQQAIDNLNSRQAGGAKDIEKIKQAKDTMQDNGKINNKLVSNLKMY